VSDNALYAVLAVCSTAAFIALLAAAVLSNRRGK